MSDLLLSHYSDNLALCPESKPQRDQTCGGRYDKPDGLWVSVDGEDDWPSWCKSEDYRDPDRQNQYRIHLAPDANILYLRTVGDLLSFSSRYPAAIGGIAAVGIDWVAVADHWQGIVIAPYQWQVRLQLNWYYTWDCASGCIWDAAAIAGIDLLREPVQQYAEAGVRNA